MIGDALENVVSAFDGFGRVISRERGIEVRFQNLSGARRNVIEKFGFDFADGLTLDEWEFIRRTFQKRHLLSHNTGVIDENYILKANDPSATVGRKIRVTHEEVTASVAIVEALGKRLFSGIFPPTP